MNFRYRDLFANNLSVFTVENRDYRPIGVLYYAFLSSDALVLFARWLLRVSHPAQEARSPVSVCRQFRRVSCIRFPLCECTASASERLHSCFQKTQRLQATITSLIDFLQFCTSLEWNSYARLSQIYSSALYLFKRRFSIIRLSWICHCSEINFNSNQVEPFSRNNARLKESRARMPGITTASAFTYHLGIDSKRQNKLGLERAFFLARCARGSRLSRHRHFGNFPADDVRDAVSRVRSGIFAETLREATVVPAEQ